MTTEINSKRLRLIPLNTHQLKLLAQSRQVLEESLGLKQSNFELRMDQDFLEGFLESFDASIQQYTLPAVESNPADYLWFTHWLIVYKEQQLTVGGIGIAGLPTEKGEVMLGYFVDKKSEGMGIATEAVQAFSNWLQSHHNVKTIVADTPKAHVASQMVLLKNGFTLAAESEEEFRWQRTFC